MATSDLGKIITLNAGQDLSSSQYCFVDIEATSGDAVLPSAGGRAIGVVQNDPEDGDAASVAISGISKVILGGTVAAGDNVKVAATGKVVTASDADVLAGACVGVCLVGGALNVQGEILILPNNQAIGSAIQTLTTDGAISLLTRTTLLEVTGTDAHTLAAGLYEGQRKTILATVAASTPHGVVSGTFIAGVTAGTSFDFEAVGDLLELEYHAVGGWRVIENIGAVAMT